MKRFVFILFILGFACFGASANSYVESSKIDLQNIENLIFGKKSFSPYKPYAKSNIPISNNLHKIKQSPKNYILGYCEFLPFNLQFFASVYLEKIRFSSQRKVFQTYFLTNEKRGPPIL